MFVCMVKIHVCRVRELVCVCVCEELFMCAREENSKVVSDVERRRVEEKFLQAHSSIRRADAVDTAADSHNIVVV